MKKKYLKKIIFTSLTITLCFSLKPVSAYAAWQKDSQQKWNWIEGKVKTVGWKNINDIWYHFNNDGVMTTGWVSYNNSWYHLSSKGSMDTGWIKDNNKWYYLSNEGLMKTGWIKDNNKWYYLSNNGSMDTGWLEYNGDIYYLKTDGEMITGNLNIDGDLYDFSESGKLISKEISNTIESNKTSNKESKTGYVLTESEPLNIRREPSISSEIIGTIPKGSEMNVIGNEVNGFYKVEYKNFVGWSSSKWISFTRDTNSEEKEDVNDQSDLQLNKQRTTFPSSDNKYYFSNNNIFYRVKLSPPFLKSDGSPIKGNCTWYAWGRIWEITGKAPTDANFTGNAYEWWQANRNTGKYKTGNKPKVGALVVWKPSLPGSGGFGHVAVIEKIENGKVYITESSWHGSAFKYRELYNIQDIYGYIYIDEPNF